MCATKAPFCSHAGSDYHSLCYRCSSHGVKYLDSEVTEISDSAQNASSVKCSSGDLVQCRCVSHLPASSDISRAIKCLAGASD